MNLFRRERVMAPGHTWPREAQEAVMATWVKVTTESGETVYLNLDQVGQNRPPFGVHLCHDSVRGTPATRRF